MRSYSKVQILTIIGTLFICVLLYFAPNKPPVKQFSVDKSTHSTLEQKIEKAVELVSSSDNPMQGIMLLREVLAEDSMNLKANFHMGLFSIQSGQFEKAISRFEKVVSIDSQITDALFYLGLAHYNIGNKDKAISSFESYQVSGNNNELLSETDKYIKELKK